MQQKLAAGEAFPEITLPTIAHGNIVLGQPASGYDWIMVVVYRGKHCPLCTKYLERLDAMKQEIHDLGIDIVLASADPEEKARRQNDGKPCLRLAYGLSIEQMQKLGLYISHPRSPQETDRPFAEPGVFVINDKGQVQVIDISNGPFARPELSSLVSGLAWIRDPKNNYPIRGTYR